MVNVGDDAPEFTVPLANDGIDSFTLSDALDEAPVVLAFFPAAFTGTCTNEMVALESRRGEFAAAGASVYGISTDSPFALDEFRGRHDIGFGLLSDYNRAVIDAYDVRTAFESMGLEGLARRSVVVVDGDGTVTYRWETADPSVEPDYDEVLAAVTA